jgi:hypothetical protein
VDFLGAWWFHGELDLSPDELNRRLIDRDLVDPTGEFVATWLDGVTAIPDRTSHYTITDINQPIEVDTNLVVVEITYESTLLSEDDPSELQLFIELSEVEGGWKVVKIQ